MAKHSTTNSPPTPPNKFNKTTEEPTTLAHLRLDRDLWHRLHILLYDLSNIATDATSQHRLSCVTHELYISEPYFTESEAFRIRTAVVEEPKMTTGDTDHSAGSVTVEEAIHAKFADFHNKRQASGDMRPCGPHDMVPVYGAVFGIWKAELRDERFLSR